MFETKDYVVIGSAPADERCVQVSKTKDYWDDMLRETLRFKQLIEKKFPEIPEGCNLKIQTNQHDFGQYCELVVEYDRDDEEAMRFALHLEINAPRTWED